MKIILRGEAKSLGLKRYFSGKACPCGHVAERYVSTYGCVECGVERRDEPKARAQTRTAGRRYHHRNKEKRVAAALSWRENNRERSRELFRNYSTSPKGRATKNSLNRVRLAGIKQAKTGFGQAGVKAIYAMAQELGMSVDHIIPLKHDLVCGLHNEFNLQILPFAENVLKNNFFESSGAVGAANLE